ncbi:hypothetical protein D3C76_1268620 [compost metagenome]
MILRFHRQHVPGVLHLRQLGHPGLLFNHFLVVHHHIFDKAKHRIAGIFQLEDAAPGQVLHRGDEKGHHAEDQTQAVDFAPRLFRLRLAAHGDYAEGKDEQADDVAVPREDGEDLRRLLHVGGVHRQ